MFRPVNPDRVTAGVCLAESFAERYTEKYNVDVGLIPCADGGTRIDQWERGSLLYDNALNNARLAMRTSSIEGILWHHGEADCPLELANVYVPKLERFIENLRADLGLRDVPFILGGLGDFLSDYEPTGILQNYTIINKTIEKVVENTAMSAFASAKGLTSNSDNLHFNAHSLYKLGHRYFEAFEKVRDAKRRISDKPLENDSLSSAMELL